MVNFRIVERDDSFYDHADKFIGLYGVITKNEIMERLNLTDGQYERLRKYCIKYKGLKPIITSKRVCRKPKYYSYNSVSGRYGVAKQSGGENVWFGGYKSEETAKRVVEKLKQCNWDKNQLERIQREVRREMMGV